MNTQLLGSPVNRTAGIVTGSGFRYRPSKKVQEALFDSPPAFLRKEDHPKNPEFYDITGVRQGRLTVIGCARGHKSKWVCRCDCGKYTIRSKKAIINPENWGDRCAICQHHAWLLREQRRKETGKNFDIREF